MRKVVSLFFVLILISSLSVQPVSAQSGGPVYIVQAGDTVSFIASRFNVTVGELAAANPSVDPNVLSEGQQIVIPGLEGITGTLETEIISFGDSLRSLSRRTQVSDEQLIRLNRLVSDLQDLWRAEARWWDVVERDGRELLRRARFGRAGWDLMPMLKALALEDHDGRRAVLFS